MLCFCPRNPLRTPLLRAIEKGYKNKRARQGIKPKAANPWTHQDVTNFLDYAHQQGTSEQLTSLQLLLLIRDAFIIAVQWETCSRTDNACGWRLANLLTINGSFHVFYATLANLMCLMCLPYHNIHSRAAVHTTSTIKSASLRDTFLYRQRMKIELSPPVQTASISVCLAGCIVEPTTALIVESH